MTLAEIPRITVDSLLARYEGILLDAYGVLLTLHGALPGAAGLIDRLQRSGRPWFILTNDASRTPETSAHRYQALGLAVPAERVITSGSLLPAHFRRESLEGKGCVVLGTGDSIRTVAEAGGRILPPADDAEVEVLVGEVVPQLTPASEP